MMSLFGDLPPPNEDQTRERKKFSHKNTSPSLSSEQVLSGEKSKTSNNNFPLYENMRKQDKTKTSTDLQHLRKTSVIPHSANTANSKSGFSGSTMQEASRGSIAGSKRSYSGDHNFQQTKKVLIGLSNLKGYVAERKGERDEMQDAHVVFDNCTNEFGLFENKIGRVSYYAVFDGHGGSRASRHCAERLHEHFIQNMSKCNVSNFPKEMKKYIIQSFRDTDDEFLREASAQKPVWKDGTTVCCVLVLDDTMYIMNLGDSKAILCRYNAEHKKHSAISLSKDHNPTNYEERQRIQKAGGQVREGRVMGILEVSRSIGDGQYKRCGVTNLPDTKRCQLNSNDRFLLIACDGLWKVYSPDQAIEFILCVLQDNSIQVPEGSSKTLEEVRFEVACNKLASEAVRKGSADNVTVLLVSVYKL